MLHFSDLIFKPHPAGVGGVIAHLEFPNGYGVSVIQGELFYCSDGSEYEVAVLKGGRLCYDSGITDDVLGHQTRDEVEEIMRQVAALPVAEDAKADFDARC